MIFEIGLGVLFLFLLYNAIVIVRPTHRALIERLGKYNRFLGQGFHLKIPFLENVFKVNITEKMMDVEPQEVITEDNLNAGIDAQIYYKIRADETSVKASLYNVYDYEGQITQLARTTLRDVIGKLPFQEVNSKRGELNNTLATSLKKETMNWGIEVIRTELKEIEPPKDVQDTMNKVLKAENEKRAALDYATAKETEADGTRRATIKEAEGKAKAIKLKADAEANAIKLVSDSAQKHFKDRALLLKQLTVVENTLDKGTKWVLPAGSPLLNVLPLVEGESKGDFPEPIKQLIKPKKKDKDEYS